MATFGEPSAGRRPTTCARPDQYAEAGEPHERRICEVDDDVSSSPADQCGQGVPEKDSRIGVELAADMDYRTGVAAQHSDVEADNGVTVGMTGR